MKKINPINPGKASVVALFLLLVVAVVVRFAMGAASGTDDTDNQNPNSQLVIKAHATAYYCPYNSGMDGTQTLTVTTVSGKIYIFKASFLFGGKGIAMQGTGRSDSNGVYIRYDGGGGKFAHIKDKNEFTDEVKKRYADMGVDVNDLAGFGGLALSNPDKANFSIGRSIIGASSRKLVPMYSIAVDPRIIPLGETGKLVFKSGTMPDGKTTEMDFSADDTGGIIDGKKRVNGKIIDVNEIDVYVGEGEGSIRQWYETGGNRLVDVIIIQGRTGEAAGITEKNKGQRSAEKTARQRQSDKFGDCSRGGY